MLQHKVLLHFCASKFEGQDTCKRTILLSSSATRAVDRQQVHGQELYWCARHLAHHPR